MKYTDLLIKNGYYCFIATEESGCSCYIPKNIFLKHETDLRRYKIKGSKVLFYNKDDKLLDSIEGPKYILRLLGSADVSLKLNKRNMPLSLIKIDNNNQEVKDLVKIFNIELSEEDKEKELRIRKNIFDILCGEYEAEEDIEEGCKMLFNFFHSGGFK